MIKVTVLRGIPASGKSTWAKDFCKKNESTVRISRDDIRNIIIPKGMWKKEYEDAVTRYQRDMIKYSLTMGNSVIIDDTNINDGTIKNFKAFVTDIVKSLETEVLFETKWFHVSGVTFDDMVRRDSLREASVGKDVIEKYWKKYFSRKDFIEESEVIKYGIEEATMNIHKIVDGVSEPVVNENGKLAVIVDIDGTLAKMHNRNPFDWSKVENDHVNHIVKDVVALLKTTDPYYEVLLVSGRSEAAREGTDKWLYSHGIFYDELIMRRDGDNRKDSIVKKELYMEHIYPKYKVQLVLDDRNSVVNMWRKELGLTCFQVADGDF